MSKQQQNITAIIYNKRGKVLAIGKNSYIRTSRLQRYHATKTGNPEAVYCHAEIHAIQQCTDLSKAHRIEVTRRLKNGKTGLAKPCEICDSAIKAAGISVVQWSINETEKQNV